jgi:hypothetical protein
VSLAAVTLSPVDAARLEAVAAARAVPPHKALAALLCREVARLHEAGTWGRVPAPLRALAPLLPREVPLSCPDGQIRTGAEVVASVGKVEGHELPVWMLAFVDGDPFPRGWAVLRGGVEAFGPLPRRLATR